MIRASELKLANRLVSQLREANGQVQIDPDELVTLIRAAQSVISAQPVMVELTVPVKIVGDVHGQFEDLRRIFDRCGWPPIHNYLFLGDYVDRGNHQIETISLLLALKVLHPNKLFLLRGNHECPEVNRFYGFLDELQRRGYGQRFYRLFNVCFAWMPLTALIENRILAMHGGLPMGLESLDRLRQIPRPFDLKPDVMEVDLLWADPSEDPGWQANESRGVGHTFGPDILRGFCDRFNLDLIVRAHQVCPKGFEFFGSQRQLVTIFSAPNYGGEAGNDAAILHIGEDLTAGFEVLLHQPQPH